MPDKKNNPETPAWTGLLKVAIVGAAAIKGKEIKDALEERNFPARDILLLDEEHSLGQLESVAEETTFIQSVTRASFDSVDLVFFAGSQEFTRSNWQAARSAGCAVVDASYGLETDPAVPVRSPWLDKELEIASGPNVDLETTAVITAHPAATMLGMLLWRAHKTGAVKRSVASVFEPVSEQGKQGMDELHQQTLNLLNFHPLPKSIFDTQIAFNMMAAHGKEGKAPLADSEARILRHLKTITRSRMEMPAMQLLQAPVFHGYTMSIYLELDRKVAPADFALAFQGEHVTVINEADDQPNNVNAAGQETIGVVLRADASNPHGIFLLV
jgi:aspartate-semialdehyde dehydrogenase